MSFIKIRYFLSIYLLYSSFCFSQNTYVPDDNFEQELINLGYDSGPLDDYVLTANISNISSLSLSILNIADLTGIEDFTSLTNFNCAGNIITSLDLGNNINLVTLSANNNQINTINIEKNVLLEVLNINDNLLSNIDISQNTQLLFINCNNNLLTSLSIENNLNLKVLTCFINELTTFDIPVNNSLINLNVSGNFLTDLNVTQGHSLKVLECYYNELTELNVSNNSVLSNFLFSYNNISSIDVSNNLELWAFWCDVNPISDLDLSNNINLNRIKYNETQLSSLDLSFNINLERMEGIDNPLLCSLDMRNGNNTSLGNFFNTTNNPNLNCIFVDNSTFSLDNWVNIDIYSKFIETEIECNNYIESIVRVDSLPNFTGISYMLPSLNFGKYYTQSNGGGIMLNPGDIITNTQTIYIYNETLCANNESSFDVIITSDDFIIPNFFTPNNDGEHDTWNIVDISNAIQSISIFDRFGKIITITTPNSEGWDGYYNGISMPSSTYWYSIELYSGEFIKGPFSLIRR